MEIPGAEISLCGLAVATFLFIYFLMRKYLNRTLPADGKAVLITGCDSGFGKEAAIKLAGEGYTVFAGCLNAADFSAVRNIHPLQMDVTDEKQVADALATVTKWLDRNQPQCHLAGLVLNAGIGLGVYVEMMQMHLFEKVLNINFLGAVRVVKAFLPLLRQTNDGRVVIISSMAAHFANPSMAAYCASKTAIVAFADCLRFEVSGRFGTSVSIVFPDFYATEILTNVERVNATLDRVFEQTDEPTMDAYGGREAFVRQAHSLNERVPALARTDLSPVIDSISHAIGNRFPKRRYYPIQLSTRIAFYLGYYISPKIPEFFSKKFHNL